MRKKLLAELTFCAGILGQAHFLYLQYRLPEEVPSEPAAASVSEEVSFAAILNSLDPAATESTIEGLPVGQVETLLQSQVVSSGQTSVAMAINYLTGQSLHDVDINQRYGFALLDALNSECGADGFKWRDGGDVGPTFWPLIVQKVEQERTPVVVALNGPDFSTNDRGHIVLIVKVNGEQVTIADPATGDLRNTTRTQMNEAPSHPDGNFFFYADRIQVP